MDEKPAKVLTIEELSNSLKIRRPTLYGPDREDKIPSQKIARLGMSVAMFFIAIWPRPGSCSRRGQNRLGIIGAAHFV